MDRGEIMGFSLIFYREMIFLISHNIIKHVANHNVNAVKFILAVNRFGTCYNVFVFVSNFFSFYCETLTLFFLRLKDLV